MGQPLQLDKLADRAALSAMRGTDWLAWISFLQDDNIIIKITAINNVICLNDFIIENFEL